MCIWRKMVRLGMLIFSDWDDDGELGNVVSVSRGSVC